MDNIRFYTLYDIANWQLTSSVENIALPELQRGFVWKNDKIEVLWDSLLRGYPVGSFLLAKDADEHLFLLDGQQRATSIALGFYNPWQTENSERKFWSLKKVPVLWIDLASKEKPGSQKYGFRLVTQSHPWGYQNATILSVHDRRNALEIFQENSENSKEKGYTTYSLKNVFPYDSSLPVPLPFLVAASQSDNWQSTLIKLCQENLPMGGKFIKTKHLKVNFLEQLETKIKSDEFDTSIIDAVKNLNKMEIPCIITSREVLESEDEQEGEEPTLFVRLNTQGTQLSGEELIYSMYKAAFPKTKELVERIGFGFLAPSLVISLVSRIVWSELHKGVYPNPMKINNFREQLTNKHFKERLAKLIGNEELSPAKDLFQKAIGIIQSEDDISIPPVLVKELLKNSKELLLMVLHWLKIHNPPVLSKEEKRKIFAAFTALSWFGRDNTRYVRDIWDNLGSENVWSKQVLKKPYYHNNEYIMYPLVQPSVLRKFLLERVVQKKITWDKLYTKEGDNLNEQYKSILEKNFENDSEKQNLINNIWGDFIVKLTNAKNKSMLLFAQRKYINEKFMDFNQLENLEDTNSPWDWDHIYPASWVYQKRYVPENVRHWTWTIGNLRALSLEDNRSDGNQMPPAERLATVKENSFIKENDWEYWNKITDRIYDGQNKEIKIYLSAVINRLCNIYEEWYTICGIEQLFNFDKG